MLDIFTPEEVTHPDHQSMAKRERKRTFSYTKTRRRDRERKKKAPIPTSPSSQLLLWRSGINVSTCKIKRRVVYNYDQRGTYVGEYAPPGEVGL